MNYHLTIYGSSCMREYILADSGREIHIPADFFEEDEGRVVSFSRKGEIWECSWSPSSDFIFSSLGNNYLPDGGIISLATFGTGEYIRLFAGKVRSVYAVVEVYKIPVFRSYVLSRTIQGGRAAENDICLSDSNNISRKHFMICRQEDGWRIRNCSPNGLYLNGKKCQDGQSLSYGDRMEVFGFHMFFLQSVLICQVRKGVSIRLPECPKQAGCSGDSPESEHYPARLYHRSPRPFKLREPDPVLVEKPPDIRVGRRDSWANVFGPVFTMMIPMVSGSLFMIYASKSSGIQMNLAIYAGIVMALISGVSTIIWSIISRLLSIRDQKKELGDLTLWYRDYLKRVNDRLAKDYDSYRSSLIERSPNVNRLALLDEGSSVLWNKNPFHEDFLFCRVGIGNMPYPWEIRLPAEEFRDYGQTLWMELGEMKERYQTLYKVPILIDLRKKRLIGFSAAEKKDRMDFIRSMTIQIAAAHCYTEVKLVYIYNGNKIRAEDGIDSLRWLPHVCDRTRSRRYLASSREEARQVLIKLEKVFRERKHFADKGKMSVSGRQAHYVIFVMEPEYLEDEMFMRYFDGHKEKTGSGESDLGLTGIWITPEREGLPNSCSYIMEKNEIFQGICFMDTGGEELKEVIFDEVSGRKLDRFARKITDIRVAEMEVSREIPDTLSFFELYGVADVRELDIIKRWKKNRAYEGLRAGIGLQAGSRICILDISEKYHGPHGLVAGTTGSGKSETLQTFLLSLAVNYSPEDVSFFLIDYKGGGMSNLFEGTPHLAGQISNLSGSLVKRAMVSIKSENQRRQKLFKKYKVNNINDYQTLFYAGEASEVLAHLIIVIDEFAELKKEEPDFMRELISVAQVGRSLGVHLILATQKPGGTVDDKIWSNSRFRICLRVQDRQDSMEMLHTADAADITLPGRGYFQVGNNEIYEEFQSGWSGAPADRRLSEKRAAYPVGLNGKPHEKPLADKEIKREVISQLEAVREEICKAADQLSMHAGRKLWMEPLPDLIGLDQLPEVDSDSGQGVEIRAVSDSHSEEDKSRSLLCERGPGGRIGLFDDPVNQKQPVFELSLIQSGHILVCGVSMSGKSGLIQTFLYSICNRWRPEDFQFFGIDFGGGTLQAFRNMPQSGLLACEGENEKIRRILEAADQEMTERKKLLRGGNYFLYKRNQVLHSEKAVPLLLLAIDHYPGFRESMSEKYDLIVQKIAKEGEKTGILLLISGSGISLSEIPSSLANCFKTKICLEQKESFGYTQLLGTLHMPDLPGKGIPGRGIAAFGDRFLEFQTSLCIPDRDDYARMDYIRRKSLDLRKRMTGRAIRIKSIPEKICLETIRRELANDESEDGRLIGGKTLMTGYLDENAEACIIDLQSIYCFLIILEENKRKQPLFDMIVGSCTFRPEIDFVVIDLKSSWMSLLTEDAPDQSEVRHLSQAGEIIDYFHEIIPLIQKRAGKDPGEQMSAKADEGKQIFILITDFADFWDMASEEENNMTGFLENIWTKGRGLGITFAAVTQLSDLPSVRQLSGFSAFCQYESGMQIGGVPAEAGVFDLSDLDFKKQMEGLSDGRGLLFLPGEKPALICVPEKGEEGNDTY